MKNNVISFLACRAQPAVEGKACDILFSRSQAQAQSQPVAPNDKLIRLVHALIVQLRDRRFNQRAAVYRELDAIARSIEREAGVAPGTWV